MRPRLVHLIGGLSRGGAEGQLVRLSLALRQRGWEQEVLSLEPGGPLRRPLEAAGVAVREIPRRAFKPWRAWRLRRAAGRARAAVLLSWSAHAAVYARFAGPARRVVNVRGDLTVDKATGAGEGRLRWYRGTLEAADLVLSNSAFGLDVLRARGVRLPASAVIENIVTAPGRARAGELVGAPRIAAVGSLKRLKAYDVLLRALALLDSERLAFELQLAGEGPERERLEGLAAELGLSRRVSFLGEVDDPGPLLASAHVFVHPSRTEGLSNAVLEAMGEALPVVASRVGGNPEIVEHGATGLLVPPDDPRALAGALGALLRDPEVRGRFGQAGLELVRRRCGEASVARRYEEALLGL